MQFTNHDIFQGKHPSKGQLISEWLFDVLNFPKNQRLRI
jgi:hypothetical protein